ADRRLADPARGERAEPLAGLHDDRLDLGRLDGGRNQVLRERAGQIDAVLVDDALRERVAEAHHDGPLDLALDALRVDRAADVVGGDVAQHLDVPGLGIDLEVDGVTAVREVGEDAPAPRGVAPPRLAAGRAEDRQPVPRYLALGRRADQVAKWEVPPARANAAVGELDVVRLRLEQLRRERPQLFAQLARRLEHGVPRHVQLPRRRRRSGQ